MAKGEVQQRRRLAIVTALSALAHAGVFALIGLTTPGVRERPPLELEAVDLSLVSPTLRPRAQQTPPGQPLRGAEGRPVDAPPVHVSPLAPPADIAPSPAPAPSPDSGAGPPGANDIQRRAAARFPPGSEEARRVLRGTYGCAYPDDVGLNKREREACADRYGRGPMRPIGPGVDPEKRRRFDETAARQRRDRDWRENPTMPTGTSEEQGAGRPAGLGPASPATAPIRTPF